MPSLQGCALRVGLCNLYNISDPQFCAMNDRHHKPAKFLHQPQLALQSVNYGGHKEWACRWWLRPDAPAASNRQDAAVEEGHCGECSAVTA